jgi:hypothetical protein
LVSSFTQPQKSSQARDGSEDIDDYRVHKNRFVPLKMGCLYFSLSAAALNRIKLTKIEILVNSLHWSFLTTMNGLGNIRTPAKAEVI